MKVFVYGTLKAGESNSHLLLKGARFLGQDKAPGVLFTGPGFPMAVAETKDPRVAAGTTNWWIRGEVYEVDTECLKRLDRLEGNPDFYTRTLVKLESGEQASIYYYQHPTDRLRYLPEGEWTGRGRKVA